MRILCLSIAALGLLVSRANAQQQPAEDAMVQLTFPPNVELRLLVDYVSERLNIKFLYDEQIESKQITIKAPEQIPADSLLQLLESALKMKGLALMDADVAGWKRIALADDLTRIAQPTDRPLEEVPGSEAVTQAFELTYVTPQQISQIIQPFLTPQGANTIELDDQSLLIVTDYADNLRKMAQLIERIDQAGPERDLQFYPVKHIEAQALDQQIKQIMASRAQPQTTGLRPVDLSHDPRTNQLIIVGTQPQIVDVTRLAEALDVPLGLRTEVYQMQFIEAERIDTLVKELYDQLTIDRLYRSAIDEDDNLLIVTTKDEIHQRIAALKESMDVEARRPGSGVKFYRLKYAAAQEVLNTLRAIEQQSQGVPPGFRRGVSSLGRGGVGNPRNLRENTSPIQFVPGPNQPDQPNQVTPVETPAQLPETGATSESPLPPPPGATPTIVPGAARVTIDAHSNSIIVVADRAIQEIYEELISQLDRRRPQVMLEAKVVIIDTSDDFSLGVEISLGDRQGQMRLLEFTSFGLSGVDPVSGALSLIPGRGFNWTLVDPDNADAVLRALANHRRAKVVSAPRLLIEDNQTGTLASVTEVPFTSVNASNTVATTSFAGFAEAGTTIEATPRITENDHLQLDYTVSLNSFTGGGGEGVPPPRQTDQVASTVTIPDGYTVIVGGLNRSNFSHDRSGVPFIERIPVLRELTGTQNQATSRTTLFVFLRPIILRDDKFADLKYLSDRDLDRACEKRNFPKSGPLLIR